MTRTSLEPFRLAPRFSERIWGRSDLRPWYESTGVTGLVGEAWLTGPECLVETGDLAGRTLSSVVLEFKDAVIGPGVDCEFPLLVKMLFPNEKLSVQVHPDDALAKATGHARGKTECWYVLEAEPGATVSLGLKPGMAVADVRDAAGAKTIENLLNHVPISAGDMIYVDAGTIHAIEPGVVLLETQQTSDVTYRLYDYGRSRELYLEEGLRVMKTQTNAGKIAPRIMDGFVRLIEKQYFSVDRFDLLSGTIEVPMESAGCLVGLKGWGTVNGIELKAGQAVIVPVDSRRVEVEASGDFSFARCLSPAPID